MNISPELSDIRIHIIALETEIKDAIQIIKDKKRLIKKCEQSLDTLRRERDHLIQQNHENNQST